MIQAPYGQYQPLTGGPRNWVTGSGRGTSPAGPSAPDTMSMLEEIFASMQQPVAQTQTQTQQQNRSPELEGGINSYLDELNKLSRGMSQAYSGVQGAYGGLIKGIGDAYRTNADAVTNQQQQGALASGLTPMEAGSLGTEARMKILQQMFPQIAALNAESAQQGVNLQRDLVGLNTSAYLPFMQGVVAPYQQNVAGQTATSESIDPLAQARLLAGIVGQMEGQTTTQQELGMMSDQFAQELQQRENLFMRNLQAQQQAQQLDIDAAGTRQQSMIEAQRDLTKLSASLSSVRSTEDWMRTLEELGIREEYEKRNGPMPGDLGDDL